MNDKIPINIYKDADKVAAEMSRGSAYDKKIKKMNHDRAISIIHQIMKDNDISKDDIK